MFCFDEFILFILLAVIYNYFGVEVDRLTGAIICILISTVKKQTDPTSEHVYEFMFVPEDTNRGTATFLTQSGFIVKFTLLVNFFLFIQKMFAEVQTFCFSLVNIKFLCFNQCKPQQHAIGVGIARWRYWKVLALKLQCDLKPCLWILWLFGKMLIGTLLLFYSLKFYWRV